MIPVPTVRIPPTRSQGKIPFSSFACNRRPCKAESQSELLSLPAAYSFDYRQFFTLFFGKDEETIRKERERNAVSIDRFGENPESANPKRSVGI
jgi:hypothetical protein